ncbi:lipid-A-disaccharide synthase [Segatella oulorum]|uniref:Lipid-A-disaccharide synthase n=1 Tax=Segatella oulorum TaxID=28136 RepID=A0A1T4Q8V3_9BACT|nr:lipid-A-disaccharide synthase [Segatella oulorum]SKA00159.1 lipid-A-disaccharide synthase [Segatella oulorum]
MKYYLLVGEASGDLHAAELMKALRQCDAEARFRFFGGDKMQAVGGTCVKHYRELAYMGFMPVLLHLRTIFRNMAQCKRDIVAWHPDVVILVDYPGFNLSIAKFLKRHTTIPAYYYISPKIWAWKEWRIKAIRRDVAELFSILPFEVDFYERKHHFPIHYVGNPTAEEVAAYRKAHHTTTEAFAAQHKLTPNKPIIALLAGSRKQEIKDNLPAMMQAAASFADCCQMVLACAPAIEARYYDEVIARVVVPNGMVLHRIENATYDLLQHATAALVTSGTATLETALFGVPQVVCYKTPVPRLIRWAFTHILSCNYISLVNLIADKEIVAELFADRFSVEQITAELAQILPGGAKRSEMLAGYGLVEERLGRERAAQNAARQMMALLQRG